MQNPKKVEPSEKVWAMLWELRGGEGGQEDERQRDEEESRAGHGPAGKVLHSTLPCS